METYGVLASGRYFLVKELSRDTKTYIMSMVTCRVIEASDGRYLGEKICVPYGQLFDARLLPSLHHVTAS